MISIRSFAQFAAMVLAGGIAVSIATTGAPAMGAGTQQAVSPTSPGPSARQIGTVKAIQERAITLVTDSGSQVNVVIQDATRVLRTEPGQSDLKGATPIPLQDIQVGDRILVRGKASEDAQSIVATAVIAIKRADIEQKQAREREDWQRRGLGGIVKEVDAASQTVTISTTALAASKPVAVRISKATILRRYAPHSVKFDDAQPGTLDEVKPGDQLRARGTRSAEGSEFSAEEVVTGSFRNIAGTVSSVDPSASTLTVADLMTKKPVLVRITADSSLRKLPAMMAEGIAMRLKGAPANGQPNAPPAGPGGQAARPEGPPPEGPRAGGPPGGWRGAGQRGNGPADLQQMLSRMPPVTLAEFPKGEAVMIVSTQGTDSGGVTAITLLGGVEPILSASPEGSQQMILSPWSLGGSGPEGTGQ